MRAAALSFALLLCAASPLAAQSETSAPAETQIQAETQTQAETQAQPETPPQPEPQPPPEAAAQPLPPPPTADPRVQTIDYREDQVIVLQAAPGYQLTVELGADERVENVAVGDSGAWQVTANRRGDMLFIKPLQSGVTTNMTVVTDARLYAFDLVPLYGPSPEMAYRVRFRYPAAQGAAPADDAAGEATLIEGRYRLSGVRALRPARISDDGRHTYIEWPKDAALPAVYALDARGEETLVNGMMRDGLFVVDSVVPRLAFRIDRQVARATRVVPRRRR
ncbi:TrbG/VirB9 family P-type conjugative transfer protein [Sphingosinicella sp. LY1275]|uniref:TrbG/VirB9 family P-type conjugative transfer protein n=1 Tax=Sphingosinicella sp. LY1275 TaxID=3095379 RepID=UPI002ADEB41D|nr:TrbG/VirB9 family P-type conjugative transfer protein [Sphingosinicella sp. LY1275]MEA1015858.1 TrbG/VirB9 family P-type conjugative transfer protein [Sphingosinicella sp. LY1275]